MRYELHIPECAPSPNKTMRAHWAQRKRLWDKWGWLVAAAKSTASGPLEPLRRARVTIVRYGVKPLDPDNLVSAQKPVIDGLVRNGYVVDDSARHVELVVTEGRRPKGALPCTLVLIESLAA